MLQRVLLPWKSFRMLVCSSGVKYHIVQDELVILISYIEQANVSATIDRILWNN